MPYFASLPQEVLRGLDLSAILALHPHPLLGYLLMMLGVALAVAGYVVYRLMVALAAAVVGGALAYLTMPGFGIEGVALWSGVIGAMMVLFVVGWFLYEAAVFLVGAFAGLVLGMGLWLLTSERFTSFADLRELTIQGGDRLRLGAATLFPTIVLGILAIKWERAAITLVAVLLGSAVFALGLRYSQLQGPMGAWGPVLAGGVMALGLFLNFRPRGRNAGAADKPWLRHRAAAGE